MRSKLTVIFLSVVIVSLSSSAFAAPISYNGHWYAIVSSGTNGSWINAENNAIALGGHLVTINDAAEETWLRSVFGDSLRYWIGFNDATTEGIWVWSSGEPVTYTNWDDFEPNNSHPPEIGEDYAVINWVSSDGGWNDWDHQRPGYYHIDGIAEFDLLIVEIDVKPGSFPSSINMKKKGLVPVAIHTTADFDATTVDPETVVWICCGDVSPVKWEIYDCDELPNPDYGDPLYPDAPEMIGDEDLDLVLYFDTQELVAAGCINQYTTIATIEGETFDGAPIAGTGDVSIVKQGKP